MRNLKKFLALVLAMLMVVSAGAAVSAFDDVAADNQYAVAIDKLAKYGIVNGTGDGLFSPEDGVTRTQMAIMMARALNPAETNWEDGMAIFSDVTEWYGAIAYAYMNGIVNGVSTTEMIFNPNGGILYQDALIMAVRALGYSVSTSGNPYWLAAYSKATELGLTNNMAVKDGAKALNRAECAQLIANMISAKPADGSATIEAKNFGVATADNTTTFVVTATAKQAYDKAAIPAEAGYVGVQLIENGIPTGEVKYFPAALLGIAADDIEANFGKAFDFVNYDAATGAFDKIVAGVEPVVVAGTDVSTDANGGKITVNGVTYYPVETITGAALKNEIVVYTGGATAGNNKVLLVDKDNKVIDKDGKDTGAILVTTNGVNLYLYDGAFHTEAEATEKFGVAVPGATVNYSTYTAAQLAGLNKNYQITLYDDNRDGKFDRATVATLYMDVYTPAKDGKEQFGQMNGAEKVTYTQTLAKGDVFTYTYNTDTKVVNVVDILPVQAGVLTRINTTNVNNTNAGNNYKNVTVTVGGVDYVLANADRMNGGYIGAIVKTTDGAKFNEIKDKAVMNFVDYNDLVIGSVLNFVAYGNTIIAAQSKAATDPYNKVIIKEVTSYDSKNIYADVYLNGKVVKDVAVSSVTIGDKTTKFADLSVFQFASTVNNLVSNNLKAGTILQARENADGTISLKNTTVANEYKQTITDTTTKLEFKDGIADNAGNANAIRANASTVFYFIKGTEVKIFVGAPANGKTIDLSKATVYADKLGYGSADTNGVSGTVVVICDDAITTVTNIFTTVASTHTVYLLNDSAMTFVKATASTLGLSGSDIYRAYNVDAIDMVTGEKVSTVYVKEADVDTVKLTKGNAYTMVASNSTIKEAAVTTSKLSNVDASNFTEARNWTIADGNTSITTTTKVLLTGVAKYDLKTNKPGDVLKDKKFDVYYVLSNDNKTFVGVAVEVAPEAEKKTVTITISGNLEKDITLLADIAGKTDVTKVIKAGTTSDSITFDAKVDNLHLSEESLEIATMTWDNANYDSITITVK